MAGIVTADKVAELATGLPAVFVQCTPSLWVEAEALCSGATGERSLYMGEWVVHVSSRFWKGSAGCATDTIDDISKTIVMQRRICGGPCDMGFVARCSGVAQLR